MRGVSLRDGKVLNRIIGVLHRIRGALHRIIGVSQMIKEVYIRL